MKRTIGYLGVPTSLGSYGPGQEKTPQAFRNTGFLAMLHDRGLTVADCGDLPVRRWCPDKTNLFAQHWEAVLACVQDTETRLFKSVSDGHVPLVIGGNCTIEFGVVAANLRASKNLGLVYLDLHADMNTPSSTTEGALDWMGMAHMLSLEGTIAKLAACGPRHPLLSPSQVCFVGFDPESATEWERNTIRDRSMTVYNLADVIRSPVQCAETVLSDWGANFERLLVHFDADVVDFNDLPLAENYSKNKGLCYNHVLQFLGLMLRSPKFAGLTVTEVNPDHGAEDGSTIRQFAQDLAGLLAGMVS